MDLPCAGGAQFIYFSDIELPPRSAYRRARRIPLHYGPLRPAGARHVIQDAVDGVFIEDSEVAESHDVGLQRLQLQAELVGKIMNGDGSKIRQPRARADAGEFGDGDGDLVTVVLVLPGFDLGQFGVNTSAGVFGRVLGLCVFRGMVSSPTSE